MELKDLLKEWRIWVLIIALGLSTLAIGPSYGRQNGDVKMVTDLRDDLGIDFTGGTRVLLEIQVENKSKEASVAAETKKQLARRLSEFGLTDFAIRTVVVGNRNMIQITAPVTNQSQIEDLISQQGSFQARFPFYVSQKRTLNIKNQHTLTYKDPIITVKPSNKSAFNVSEGEKFKLDSVQFRYVEKTNERAVVEGLAYSGQDIEEILEGSEYVDDRGDVFQGNFRVLLTEKGAQQVLDLAKNYNAPPGGQLTHPGTGTPAEIRLYLDDEMKNNLTVSSSFATQKITRPVIQLTGTTREEAQNSMDRLQTILRSGKLPAPVSIESVSSISATRGSKFLAASMISIVSALVAVGILIFIRYRDPRLALPIVLTGASEVYILLGIWAWDFTAVEQIGSLSLAAIAGIIAAVGTGVDDQIIITDESGQDIVEDWSQRMKKAFFVIFTSAASTIGAMLPVLSPGSISSLLGLAGSIVVLYTIYKRRISNHYLMIGIFAIFVSIITHTVPLSGGALQSVHGFAYTTILGILIGISITRPAYAKVLEYLNE